MTITSKAAQLSKAYETMGSVILGVCMTPIGYYAGGCVGTISGLMTLPFCDPTVSVLLTYAGFYGGAYTGFVTGLDKGTKYGKIISDFHLDQQKQNDKMEEHLLRCKIAIDIIEERLKIKNKVDNVEKCNCVVCVNKRI